MKLSNKNYLSPQDDFLGIAGEYEVFLEDNSKFDFVSRVIAEKSLNEHEKVEVLDNLNDVKLVIGPLLVFQDETHIHWKVYADDAASKDLVREIVKSFGSYARKNLKSNYPREMHLVLDPIPGVKLKQASSSEIKAYNE